MLSNLRKNIKFDNVSEYLYNKTVDKKNVFPQYALKF